MLSINPSLIGRLREKIFKSIKIKIIGIKAIQAIKNPIYFPLFKFACILRLLAEKSKFTPQLRFWRDFAAYLHHFQVLRQFQEQKSAKLSSYKKIRSFGGLNLES